MNDFSVYKQAAIHLATEAGAIIKNGFSSKIDTKIKIDHSIVTNIDLAVNRLTLRTLSHAFPDIPIIAEEGDYRTVESDLAWVCDPLDGTTVFAHGLPMCAFSLALTYQGKSVLGVVYDPFQDRMIVAEKGAGTTVNGSLIQVTQEKELSNSMVGISLWAGSTYNYVNLLPAFKEENILPFNVFSIVYMGSLVATGQLSAAIYLDTHAHDVAALKVIVEEAGGMVTDLNGKDQRYDKPVRGCLISNKVLHKKYLALIAQSGIV